MGQKAFDLIVNEISQIHQHATELHEKVLKISDVMPVVNIGKLESYIMGKIKPIHESITRIRNALSY